MAKSGTAAVLGTAEDASLSRVAFSLHLAEPVLDESRAIVLHTPANQVQARDAEHFRTTMAPGVSPMAPIAAVSVGGLRYTEDEVEHSVVERGIRQYVVLGAGFDSFALRRVDLRDRLQVFEVDHPDVQALKRQRVEAAAIPPEVLPEFVPVDFEVMSLGPALRDSSFDPSAPAVFSWMNTLPYLTEKAIDATLAELGRLAAPGSRIVLNYASTATPTAEQAERLALLGETVLGRGEPFMSRFDDAVFAAMLAGHGFAISELLTEVELTARYFQGRSDGWKPGMPLRLLTAERSVIARLSG
jgi:methyltransferase (TIGR00027 family)